jgi:putative acetyltransferase
VVADLKVREERESDRRQVRQVVQAAFHAQPVVADLVDALRTSAGWRPSLSLVAEEHGAVAGHVLASRGWLDARARLVEVLVLSPLSVTPGRQGQGIGTRLVRQLLAAAASGTEPAIFLEGSPGYYRRFGFEAAGAAGFRRPSLRIPESAFQVRTFASYEPWMTGTLVYPEAFWELDCVGLR